jgi:hypothetical protein
VENGGFFYFLLKNGAHLTVKNSEEKIRENLGKWRGF